MASPTTDRRLGLVGNTAIKAPVKVVAVANITLSGEQTIDSKSVLAVNAASIPDRVLCAGQTDATQNGIYDVATGAWTRAKDADGPYDLAKGTTIAVTDGTVYAGTYWQVTSDNPLTIGTSSIVWARVLPIDGVRLVGVQVFTANGTYTPTLSTGSVVVEVQAGGGAGGGCAATGVGQVAAGGGGGAGGYAKTRLTAGFSGAAVVVGAAGAAGAGVLGGNGGTSSFGGATVSATGGTGGAVGTAASSATVQAGALGGAGGVGSGGTLANAAGEPGDWGFYCTTPASGQGGASQFGAGGKAVISAISAGNPAVSAGSGGSGGCLTASSGTAATGGAGAAGRVTVWEYA